MDATGAYGGGKAGGAFDPQQFIQRPPVIVRAVCWVSTTHIYPFCYLLGYKYVYRTKYTNYILVYYRFCFA